jgi:hypothetical protein
MGGYRLWQWPLNLLLYCAVMQVIELQLNNRSIDKYTSLLIEKVMRKIKVRVQF